ncbi:MAG: ECF transporter S component [Candidatus Limnocylindrales bacterium]
MESTAARRSATSLSPTFVLALVALGAAINVVGGYAATLTGLPLFLDMIGTCIVALLLGPWLGAAAAVLTSFALVLVSGPGNIPFAVVGVAAALVWGYGVRQLRMGRTPARYFVLNLAVVLVVAVTATPIVLWLFGGATGHPSDVITAAFSRLGPWGAVFADNLLVNTVDKVVTGYLALSVVQALPARLAQGATLPGGPGNHWVVVAATGLVAGVVLLVALLALRAVGA